jgi:hypothetical protein
MYTAVHTCTRRTYVLQRTYVHVVVVVVAAVGGGGGGSGGGGGGGGVYVRTYVHSSQLLISSTHLSLEAEGTAGLTRRAVLRGISRALPLQQGYRLAHIVEEIHAPDRAAQGTGEGGNGNYQDRSR